MRRLLLILAAMVVALNLVAPVAAVGKGKANHHLGLSNNKANSNTNQTTSSNQTASPATTTSGKNGPIAFESPSNYGGRDIWVQWPSSQQPIDLTSNLQQFATNFHPAFSPDGTKIAFTRDTDPFGPGNDGIYVMNADGSNQTKLTSIVPDDGGDPSWSPDGKQILFENGSSLFVMNADGTSVKNLNASGRGPQFSPDGSKIAFWRNGDIWLMNPDGTNQTNLTNNSAGSAFGPSWSPDGTKIAFGSKQAGNGHYDIWVMDPNGQNQKNLTNNTSADTYEPSWSPDGTKIAYVNQQNGYAIYTMSAADGTGQTPLTSSSPFHFSPTWGIDNDTTPPTVSNPNPANLATGVNTASVTATIADNKGGSGINSSTINTNTFQLVQIKGSGNVDVPGTVSYDASSNTATFTVDPSYLSHGGSLPKGAYQATITTGVTDNAGNALANDYTWQFATAGPSQ